MSFYQAVASLKKHLDEIDSIGSLRKFLAEKNLNLVTTITTNGFNGIDWNITQAQVAGVLHLAIKVRLSSLISDHLFLQTTLWDSIEFHRIDEIDQEYLFELLKSGFKSALEKKTNEYKW